MEQAADIQLYVRLISGTILGLTVGKLLSGTAKFIQHPHAYKFNALHGLWIAFIFCSVVIFWWQEAMTFASVKWTFPLYLFQITYCASFLFMTAVLLPDEVDEFDSHYDYFIARRHWFYGALIISYLLGIGNELVKQGWDDIFADPSYIVVNIVLVAILATGTISRNRRVHLGIGGLFVLMAIAAAALE